MSKLLRGIVAGAGAWKWGGGCLSTILIFVLLWWFLGNFNIFQWASLPGVVQIASTTGQRCSSWEQVSCHDFLVPLHFAKLHWLPSKSMYHRQYLSHTNWIRMTIAATQSLLSFNWARNSDEILLERFGTATKICFRNLRADDNWLSRTNISSSTGRNNSCSIINWVHDGQQHANFATTYLSMLIRHWLEPDPSVLLMTLARDTRQQNQLANDLASWLDRPRWNEYFPSLCYLCDSKISFANLSNVVWSLRLGLPPIIECLATLNCPSSQSLDSRSLELEDIFSSCVPWIE